jgi:hypothetical protein
MQSGDWRVAAWTQKVGDFLFAGLLVNTAEAFKVPRLLNEKIRINTIRIQKNAIAIGVKTQKDHPT